MSEVLYGERLEMLQGPCPPEPEKLIDNNLDDLTEFVRALRSERFEDPCHAEALLSPDSAVYNSLISKIYNGEYTSVEQPERAPEFLAADIEAMNRFRDAANNNFFSGNYGNVALMPEIHDMNQEYSPSSLSRPMRLISGIITPLRMQQNMVSNKVSRQQLSLDFQKILGLSDVESDYCSTRTEILFVQRAELVKKYILDLSA